MSKLAKGGKWVYGWTVVGPHRDIVIPSDACTEFGLHKGDELIFFPGSRLSGGFGVTTERLMRPPMHLHELGRAEMEKDRRVVPPPSIDLAPGERLLIVRGSRMALGFVAHGPIYETALSHPEIAECRPTVF
jgi:hypothetical protein